AVGERTEKGAAGRVVGVDAAIAVVADQQGAAERTEIRRRHGESPRRVERAPGSEAPQEVAVRVVDVEEPVPGTGDVIVPTLVLLGIGDDELVVDGLDVEWSKTLREVRVLEGAGTRDRLEVLVEHIDRATAEIGGVEEAAAGGIRGEGETFVHRPGRRSSDSQ